MTRFFLLILSAFALTACSPSRSPEAAGQYNLSKGQCLNIPMCDADGCKTVNDDMVQDQCQVVGGEFVPRDHQEIYWF